MSLQNKRLVVSFGNPERGEPTVIEGDFPGFGPLSSGEKARNIFLLASFRLTHKGVMTYGELEVGKKYVLAERAKKVFQLMQDMTFLGADDLINGLK